MAAPNRWAIRDAGIVSFYTIGEEKPIVTLRTLKASGLENTGQTVYARGGFGNPKLVGFSSDREVKLTLQDALWDNKAVAMLTGNDLLEGEFEVSKNQIVDVIGDVASLKMTPVGDLLGVFAVLPDGTLGEEYDGTSDYTVLGKEITFDTGLVPDGSKVAVYYKVKTDATAKAMKVTSDAFGKSFKVVMDCLVRDAYDDKDYQATIIIPKAKFEDNFNLSLAVDGDPAVLDLNMELLKDPLSTDMWTMVIHDESLIQ